jgi:ribose transport system substrate-binding protein
VGAAQAVEQLHRTDDLWLAAFDSNIQTLDALQSGAADALVIQNTYGMGYFGVESAFKLLAGQGSSVEKSNITATRTITRENMFAMDKQKVLFPFG